MYLAWSQYTLPENYTPADIDRAYDSGYLLVRRGKGEMDMTRSVRIDLNAFSLSSENRRILKKNQELEIFTHTIPYNNYSWEIGKMAKDFYDTKFGRGTFSANKVKELITDGDISSFNTLFQFVIAGKTVGYAIGHKTASILHYSYPFYELASTSKDLGLGMMTKSLLWAKDNGLRFVYLGSAQRPTDTYKLQFNGLEWWDKDHWNHSESELKSILSTLKTEYGN